MGAQNGHQVGYAVISNNYHASLWTNTPNSWIDLNPAGARLSVAYAVHQNLQAGFATMGSGSATHAGMWSGTANSWVDLHEFLPASFIRSEARGIWTDGSVVRVVGFGYNTITGKEQALMWETGTSAPTVSGRIFFNDYAGAPISSATIEYKDSSFAVVHSESAALDVDGNFTVTGPPTPGDYYVSVQSRNWLRRTVGPVTTTSNVTNVELNLINGDCDVDNEITLVDFGNVSASFGKALGDPGFDPNADLDGDDEVTLVDVGIISRHFGQAGDE